MTQHTALAVEVFYVDLFARLAGGEDEIVPALLCVDSITEQVKIVKDNFPAF